MNKPRLTPSASHPITVEPLAGQVVVRVGGQVVADTHAALSLQEASYPAVAYVPLTDVDPAVLTPSATTSYCPNKGDCSYYDLQVSGGAPVRDAVWTYAEPYPAVSDIAGHVAFYPTKVEVLITPA